MCDTSAGHSLALSSCKRFKQNPQQAMGRGIVESLVAAIKEVPLPSRHAALAPLLAPPPSPAPFRNQRAAAPAAAASGASLLRHSGFAFVSLEATVAAAAALQHASPGGGKLGEQSEHASPAGGRTAAASASSASSSLAAAAAAAASAPLAGHQIMLMVVGSTALGTLRRACDLVVVRSYKEAARCAEALRELEPARAFGAAWDAEVYKSRPHTIGGLRRDAAVLRCVRGGMAPAQATVSQSTLLPVPCKRPFMSPLR
jgi:hypothetical protein